MKEAEGSSATDLVKGVILFLYNMAEEIQKIKEQSKRKMKNLYLGEMEFYTKAFCAMLVYAWDIMQMNVQARQDQIWRKSEIFARRE